MSSLSTAIEHLGNALNVLVGGFASATTTLLTVLIASWHMVLGQPALPLSPAPLPSSVTSPSSLAIETEGNANTPATPNDAPDSPIISSTTNAAPPSPLPSVPTVATPLPTVSKPPPSPSAPTQTPIDIEALNTQTRRALVNIYCLASKNGGQSVISGTGVLVDTRGIILTNAHVAQFMLLKDYPNPGTVSCTIRTGAPAVNTYIAAPLYISEAWVLENASEINAEVPMGTGENDYAFLQITKTTNGSALPSEFPALPMTASQPDTGDNMLLAAYPAGFLSGMTLQSGLYPSSALSLVRTLYSFHGGETVEAFSLGGSVVAQAGSSGGAVVETRKGALIGIISSEISATSTADRDLRAVSIAHIDQSLTKAHFGGLQGLLSSDLDALRTKFETVIAPELRQVLLDALKK